HPVVSARIDERPMETIRTTDDAPVWSGLRPTPQYAEHRDGRRDAVALLQGKMFPVHKSGLAICLRREDGQDREEVWRVADIDRLPHEVAAPNAHAIPRGVDPRSERPQEVDDPAVPFGGCRVEPLDGHIAVRDRGGDERKCGG